MSLKAMWLKGYDMIRIVLVGLAVVAVWLLLLRIIRFARKRQIDWTGVAFMIGFVAIAFYLRHATGLG